MAHERGATIISRQSLTPCSFSGGPETYFLALPSCSLGIAANVEEYQRQCHAGEGFLLIRIGEAKPHDYSVF